MTSTLDDLIISVDNYLKKFSVADDRILKVIRETDRTIFMNAENHQHAYEDRAYSIGYNQTISQPSTVARMISLLQIQNTDIILEIGTGSGWNAVLMSKLAKEIVTYEIVLPLVDKVKQILLQLNIDNVVVKDGDFRLEPYTKFNKIIFTAGMTPDLEAFIIDFARTHLDENGIVICPCISGPLLIGTKQHYNIDIKYTDEKYAFVPLIV